MQDEAGEKANHASGRIVTRVIVRLLAFVVAMSFLAALLPLAKVSAASSTMACCVGKEESHCHASAKAKKAAAHDHDSSKPVFQSAINKACHSDCCACSVSTQQQKRERGTAQPIARFTSSTVRSHAPGETLVFSSSDLWAQINPRGPPPFLL